MKVLEGIVAGSETHSLSDKYKREMEESIEKEEAKIRAGLKWCMFYICMMALSAATLFLGTMGLLIWMARHL